LFFLFNLFKLLRFLIFGFSIQRTWNKWSIIVLIEPFLFRFSLKLYLILLVLLMFLVYIVFSYFYYIIISSISSSISNQRYIFFSYFLAFLHFLNITSFCLIHLLLLRLPKIYCFSVGITRKAESRLDKTQDIFCCHTIINYEIFN
jgi:hypothetical protein